MRSLPRLRGELLQFLHVGGGAVAIDAGFYFLLCQSSGLDPTWCKSISFAVGALWAFGANKFFTFGQTDYTVNEPLFIAVYLVGSMLNSFCHDLIMRLKPWGWLAFFGATGLPTVTNFVGQKWIVFRAIKRSLS